MKGHKRFAPLNLSRLYACFLKPHFIMNNCLHFYMMFPCFSVKNRPQQCGADRCLCCVSRHEIEQSRPDFAITQVRVSDKVQLYVEKRAKTNSCSSTWEQSQQSFSWLLIFPGHLQKKSCVFCVLWGWKTKIYLQKHENILSLAAGAGVF